MKLYTKRHDNNEFVEVGESTKIDKNTEVLFIRLNTMLHPNDVDRLIKDIEIKSGKRCVVVDKTVDLVRAE